MNGTKRLFFFTAQERRNAHTNAVRTQWNNDEEKSGWFLWIRSIWFCGCAVLPMRSMLNTTIYSFDVSLRRFSSSSSCCSFLLLLDARSAALQTMHEAHSASLIFELTNSNGTTKQVCDHFNSISLLSGWFSLLILLFEMFKTDRVPRVCCLLLVQSSRLHIVCFLFLPCTSARIQMDRFHIFSCSSSDRCVRAFSLFHFCFLERKFFGLERNK